MGRKRFPRYHPSCLCNINHLKRVLTYSAGDNVPVTTKPTRAVPFGLATKKVLFGFCRPRLSFHYPQFTGGGFKILLVFPLFLIYVIDSILARRFPMCKCFFDQTQTFVEIRHIVGGGRVGRTGELRLSGALHGNPLLGRRLGGYEHAGGLWDCVLRALRRRLLHPHAPAVPASHGFCSQRKTALSTESAAVTRCARTALWGRSNYVSGHDASVPKPIRGFPIVWGP